MRQILLLSALLLSFIAQAADSNTLKPIMVVPAKVHLQMDFNTDFVIEKKHPLFTRGQGTQWQAKDGLLVGTQSTPEYQAMKKKKGNGHLGTAPRLQFPNSPKDVIISYSFKIVDGKFTKLLPMIEAGHHLRRIYFGEAGSKILVEHEKTTIAEDPFVLKLDTWYHVMLEIKNDDFLVRFQDGPTVYGQHKGVGAEFANYNIGITATNKGSMYIDNMSIWHAGDYQKEWPRTQKAIQKK
ncbi:MAG: hypothetical protein ACI8W8_001506 [Rhodothermales bacterium]|jgi:hypothetical protein